MLNSVIHALPLNTSLIAFTIDGCQNVLGLKKNNASNYHCGLRVQKILNIIHQDYKDIPILVINRSNTVFNGVLGDTKPEKYVQNIYESFSKKYQHEMQTAYLATYKELSKQNPVFVTTPTPEAHAHIPTAAAKFELYGLNENLLKIPVSEYFSRSEASLETQNIAHQEYGVNIIDLSKEFCDENFCYFTKNGIPIFYDDDHMSWQASLMLTPLFKKEIFGKK